MESRKLNYYGIFSNKLIKQYESLKAAKKTKCALIIEEDSGFYLNQNYKNRDVKFQFLNNIENTSSIINWGKWKFTEVKSITDSFYQRTTLSINISDPEGELRTKTFPNFDYRKENFVEFIFGIEKLGNWDQVEIYEENERLKSEIESLEWQLKNIR